MLRFAKKLLKLAEEQFPNKEINQHHGLLLINDKLTLHIVQNNKFYTFTIEDGDFSKSAEEIIGEMKKVKLD